MAAPAYRSAAISNIGTTNDVAGVEPPGAALNDIEIAFHYQEADNAITPGSGWSSSFNGTTLMAECNAATAFRMQGFWIRRGASAPDLNFIHASAFRFMTIAAFSGAITSGDPFSFGTFAVRDDATAKTWASTSGTTNSADELLVWGGFASDAGGAGTPPTGYTEHLDIIGGALNLELCSLAQAVAGATGSVSGASYSGGNNGTTALLFMGLKSTAGGGGSSVTYPELERGIRGVGRGIAGGVYHAPAQAFCRRDRIFVPAWIADADREAA